MERLKFEITKKAKPEDAKSNIFVLTSITNMKDETFVIPTEYQPITLHKEITKSDLFEMIKKTLKKRNEKREVWIPLTPEMKETYFKEDNMQFDGFLLEKIENKEKHTDVAKETVRQVPIKVNGTKLVEKFALDKFSRNTTNVSQWLNTYEKECERLEIDTDVEKIEMLRLLLEDSCKDWYGSMIIKHTIDSNWDIWKKSLNETYADKGWTPTRYAINFKYLQGSILDYALKKERSLLEVNKSIDKTALMDIIATGLPNYIADKIDRKDLKEVDDLFNNIRGLEHLVKRNDTKKNWSTGNRSKMTKSEAWTTEKTPCKTCEQKGKKNRYHPETLCWYKNEKKEEDNLMNSLLSVELSNENPKN